MEREEYIYDTESDLSESCDKSDWSENSGDSCDELQVSEWTPSDIDWSQSSDETD